VTLDQWSNLFVHASMAVYAAAFVAFAVSFGASRTPQPDKRAQQPVLAGVGAVGAAETDASNAVTTAVAPAEQTPADAAARARAEARASSPRLEAEMARDERGRAARRRGGAGAGGTAEDLAPGRRAGNIGMSLTWLAFGLLLIAVALRGIWAGRAPWGNMYEFSLATALAVTGMFLAVSLRRDVRWLGVLVTAASLLTLGVAVLLLYTDSPQLVPALHSYWLIIHVAAAIISSGAFTVGAAATVCYLMADRAEREAAPGYQPRTFGGPLGGVRSGIHGTNSRLSAVVARRVPDSATLDALAYKVNAFVFPLWTFAVIAGAIWAEDAWGRYWGWDPKETWAFITWLVYAAYLHARATAGWRGRKAAAIALVGFACFLINYFGVNLFASGLHSYSGM
jgi:cytochrome c-type biogenesis protein CcsB